MTATTIFNVGLAISGSSNGYKKSAVSGAYRMALEVSATFDKTDPNDTHTRGRTTLYYASSSVDIAGAPPTPTAIRDAFLTSLKSMEIEENPVHANVHARVCFEVTGAYFYAFLVNGGRAVDITAILTEFAEAQPAA